MELQPDGSLLIRAAIDGPLEQLGEDKVEGRYTTYLNRGDAVTVFERASAIAGMSITMPDGSVVPSVEPERRAAPPGPRESNRDVDVLRKQQLIQQEIAKMRMGRDGRPTMSYDTAWQRLQSTRPELFEGLEDRVVHPD